MLFDGLCLECPSPSCILMRGRVVGSTMDAMSDAIEGADVMLYAVSLRYKESSNCRMVRRHVCCALTDRRS